MISSVYFVKKCWLMSCRCLSTPPKNLVKNEEILRFYKDCLVKGGASEDNAKEMAEVLHGADSRGHVSHGINRIGMYVDELCAKAMDGCAKPEILNETPCTAWIDGKNGLGPIVGNFCMTLAIKKAKENNVSCVTCKGSNHYGISGWYTLRAVEKGLIGLTCSNTSPLVVPTGAKMAALGTNPFSIAAPSSEGGYFLLDFATSNVAVGKIEVSMKKNVPIPDDWALDSKGNFTTNAKDAFEAKRLLPMGGRAGGYKGFGFGMIIEILCGILSDSAYGPNIRKWMEMKPPANLSQTFICINPEAYAPNFKERLGSFSKALRAMPPIDAKNPIRVHGDFERKNKEKSSKLGGVDFDDSQLKLMKELAKKMKVKPMEISKK